MHLSEEDLILHYYGEADDNASVESHLSSCSQCQAEFARLQRVLRLVDEQPVPELSPAFERQMWARIAPQLPARRRSWISSIRSRDHQINRWFLGPRWTQWAFAGGLAVLLIAAFVAGRVSGPIGVAPAADVQAVANDRVLLVAVVDHLDRSQMVLVEVLNGDAALDISGEQSRARDLVSANRLYRQSATYTGDEAMGEVLEDLERVLLEIANVPDNATAEELKALREGIETRGLLFKVRVVHSQMRERERLTVIARGQS